MGGWTDTVNQHLSARVPGEPNHFLINTYGEMFDEVTASSLLKMDMDGNVVGDSGRFNNAGFTIHSGVYKARPDANCVLHTHTRAGAGVSLLRPISPTQNQNSRSLEPRSTIAQRGAHRGAQVVAECA